MALGWIRPPERKVAITFFAAAVWGVWSTLISAGSLLHYAAFSDSPLLIRLLLAAGAQNGYARSNHSWFNTAPKRPSIRRPTLATPLQIAAFDGNLGALKMLAAGMNQNLKDDALYYAIMGGNSDAMSVLLALGADPNRPSGADLRPPLIHAVARGRSHCRSHLRGDANAVLVKALLAAGADPNIKLLTGSSTAERQARDGWGPLYFAVRTGRSEVVKVLLEYGADPNAKHAGETLLAFIEKMKRGGASADQPALTKAENREARRHRQRMMRGHERRLWRGTFRGCKPSYPKLRLMLIAAGAR